LQLSGFHRRAPQQEFDLRVERAKLGPGPALQCIVQRRVETEQKGLALGGA